MSGIQFHGPTHHQGPIIGGDVERIDYHQSTEQHINIESVQAGRNVVIGGSVSNSVIATGTAHVIRRTDGLDLGRAHQYAGIGSRATPWHVQALMTAVAAHLHLWGWTLRTGGASGADQAWMQGSQRAEIYRPTPVPDATVIASEAHGHRMVSLPDRGPFYRQAEDLAATIHPNWEACSAFARQAHARNVAIILGPTLSSPVSFVVYWAEEDDRGQISGGTRTGVVLARQRGIPTYNLARPVERAVVVGWLQQEAPR